MIFPVSIIESHLSHEQNHLGIYNIYCCILIGFCHGIYWLSRDTKNIIVNCRLRVAKLHRWIRLICCYWPLKMQIGLWRRALIARCRIPNEIMFEMLKTSFKIFWAFKWELKLFKCIECQEHAKLNFDIEKRKWHKLKRQLKNKI